MPKVKCSRELRFEIAKEYLNMPSMASISRWLKTFLMQNSEEMIADEAPEPFILICRIETPHHREEPRMAAMWCAELRQGYKKPVQLYTTPVLLFTLLRFDRESMFCIAATKSATFGYKAGDQ